MDSWTAALNPGFPIAFKELKPTNANTMNGVENKINIRNYENEGWALISRMVPYAKISKTEST